MKNQPNASTYTVEDFIREFGGNPNPKPALDVKVGDVVTCDTPAGVFTGTVRTIYSVIGQAYLRAGIDTNQGLPITVPLPIVQVIGSGPCDCRHNGCVHQWGGGRRK